MDDKAKSEIITLAENEGTEHGRNAGSWVFDGNSDVASMRQAVRWSDDGDPRLDEIMPTVGTALPERIVFALAMNNADPDEQQDVRDAYCSAFRAAAEDEAIGYARRMVAP